MKNTCMFTGHRVLSHGPVGLLNTIKATIERLAAEGYSRFVSGGAVGFDLLCAQAVLELKEGGLDLYLIMVLPCKNQDAKYSQENKQTYRLILSAADEVLCLTDEYYGGCMLVRNKAMVNMSTFCVAYQLKSTGGTAFTVNYAQKQGITVENLADKPESN